MKKWLVLLIVISCALFAASSGCSESGEDGNHEDAEEEEEIEMEITSTGNSEDWCSVGSSWQASNPQTGEMVTMKITGTEVIDGVLMCKAVYETNTEEDVSKIEYLWSEDGETVFWIAYDESGKMVSSFSMKEGKITVTDEEGNVMEINQDS
ncbi:hypothetical protein [Methanosarcina sp. KYL-1]|uniref:hypothetical protein n=1 Tax=Methanosarcina sp. KYL-1 TaxID=2602068 RepID=UPI0021019E09|nr:hypothetical protein [Methanosarcina sp. KYL-1]